jgi:formate dehydrogenase subunit gamma
MATSPTAAAETTVRRHALDVRIVHWIVAISFILLALSGLALFYPGLYFLTGLFGGGETARMLHPWIGLVLAVGYLDLFIRMVGSCLWSAPEDNIWMGRLIDVMRNREEGLPEIGKFNPGQKLYFWAMALLIVVLLVTGIITWHAYFGALTSIPTQRVAVLLHSIAAVLAIIAFIVHVHMGTWEAGTLRAMTRGTVTGGWAWKHHRKWLRQVAIAQHGKSDVRAPAE